MSEEDIEALRAAYEPLARGDFSGWADLPDDFELVTAGEMPDAGSYRGEAARRWLATWAGSFERLTLEAVDFTNAGNQVVTEVRQRGWLTNSGTAMELRTWAVTTGRGGTLARMELFLSRTEAFEAAGLSEQTE